MSIDQIQREHQTWREHNFPNADATQQLFGVIEEVGELTHAYLKMQQGIRGTREDHLDAMVDALGDISIYLIGYLGFHGIEWESIVRHIANFDQSRDPQHHLLKISKMVGRLASWQDVSNIRPVGDPYRQTFTRLSGNLVGHLDSFSRCYDWDLAMIIHDTWDSVKKRDWIANSQDGQVLPSDDPPKTGGLMGKFAG